MRSPLTGFFYFFFFRTGKGKSKDVPAGEYVALNPPVENDNAAGGFSGMNAA
ncbi:MULTISPECIES: hypothetical protein [Enterobacter]|uniref:hypothetical protein n=1 Tax=Enterobacter TaxID=547 RepID=UPI000AA92BE4|nr:MULTISPECIES: hypothetical protein [Enterobacter]EKS6337604.1 hypothetical protein [Enterobacter hormaechei]